MGRRLYVGNLSYDTTELELREVFGKYGTVADAKVVTDRETGRPRGFAFVEMSSDQEAQNSIAELNGRELGGRALNVNEAQERSGGGGSRGGGGGGARALVEPAPRLWVQRPTEARFGRSVDVTRPWSSEAGS